MLVGIIVLFCVGLSAASDLVARQKRQMYYLCGTFPNQYYSTTPCWYDQAKCTNGGSPIGVGCTNSAQCTPYYAGISTCLNGCCCTVPTTTRPPSGSSGLCYNGQASNTRCSAQGQCPSEQTCMNGLCCSTTGNEWQYACGGLVAIASCTNNQCTQGFSCTPSNYCCECPVGRSSGRCNAGTCPSGFTCQANGYCCSSCPGNVTPYGSCVNGQCGGGATCRAGNICCL
uniref:CC domain-containing protein n=1 Tax=Panagrellus redivivus TaxID=6233 RepID=A0A7E4ZYF6_PANRE